MPTSNAAAICFALFVFAGYYKAADLLQFIPIDLTLLFAAGTSAFCGFEIWRTRSLGPGIIPMLAVFLALAIGLHWPEHFGSYATQKELRLFSITALSAFAPLILLRTDTRRQTFAYTVCLLGLVMAGLAVFEAARHGLSPRATVFNANPILLARASGFAGLVLCLLYWQGRLNTWLFAPPALIALVGLLASGTKAPLLGLLLTAFAFAPLALVNGASRKRTLGTLAAGCVGLAGALAYLAWAGVYVARRIAGPLTGEWGFAGETRLALWRQTLELIPMHPFGIGWGRFNEWIQLFENRTLMRHPHNIALEIFVEGGWLAGAAFLALAVVLVRRSTHALYKAPATTNGAASADVLLVPAGLVYWLICAAFSGDVNDNRPLWALLGVTLAALGSRRISKSDGLEDTVEVGDRREPLTGA
jgi:O-antigen ligase